MTLLKEIEFNSWFRKKIILFSAILIILLTIVEIWAVNRMATFGVQISKLEQAKIQLEMENLILEKEIAQKSSIAKIQQEARELGLVKVKNIQYLDDSNGLALKSDKR